MDIYSVLDGLYYSVVGFFIVLSLYRILLFQNIKNRNIGSIIIIVHLHINFNLRRNDFDVCCLNLLPILYLYAFHYFSLLLSVTFVIGLSKIILLFCLCGRFFKF
jgi:hypothetical protein